MFRYRQPLRRWAARVLFLWLFGVVAGVANACMIPTLNAPDGFTALLAVESAAPHHGHVAGPSTTTLTEHRALGADENSAGGESPASANCLDFCDTASISIPPLKSAVDDGQVQAMAPPTLPTVLPVPAFVPVRLQVLRWIDVAALPIPIAFLRLAL